MKRRSKQEIRQEIRGIDRIQEIMDRHATGIDLRPLRRLLVDAEKKA